MMTYHEIILVIIGIILIGISIFILFFKGSTSGHPNSTIKIFGVEISLSTPVLFVFILGIILLFSPTINTYFGANKLNLKLIAGSDLMMEQIDEQINKKINNIVRTIDSGYSREFVFEGREADEDKKEKDNLLFYATKGQEVTVNIFAPYESLGGKVFLKIIVNNSKVEKRELFRRDRGVTIPLDLSKHIERGLVIHAISFEVLDENDEDYFGQPPKKRPLKVSCVVTVKKQNII